MIEILTSGAANSVQDRGRLGFLDIGVSRSGAMDDLALALGQALVGNPADAAGLEIGVFPFRLRLAVPTLLAVTGAVGRVTLAGRVLPPHWAAMAPAGAELRLDPPDEGARAYVAFAGGIAVPTVLGSHATDLKSGWGGFHGRGLARGDRLTPGSAALAAADPRLQAGYGIDPAALPALREADGAIALRVLPGAEWTDYPPETRAMFAGKGWSVSADANRQGYRLDGPLLIAATKRDLFSHGIMPGTVQVPPSGQPIIQLAEANSCGGYPKIAHVIEADLWKLGQAGPGDALRFAPVTRDEAIAALGARRRLIADVAATAALVGRFRKGAA